MKKLLNLTLTFFLALTFLSACGNNPPSLEDRIAEGLDGQEVIYSYNGIIEPLELDVYQSGTHQIRTDDSELIIIQSQKYDLNKYVEKRVNISGVEAQKIGNAERVLNVTEIELEDGEFTDEEDIYESILYGFRVYYPGIWELNVDSGDITLSKGDKKWVSIDIYNDKTDLDSFAESEENEKGTSVTIASQRSLRFIHGDQIKMYVPNPPKKKIYVIKFNEEEHDVNIEKEYFYNLLENFELIYISAKKGDKCGGEDDIKCLEGYICEFDSGEENAEGICISVSSDQEDLDCPFIASPIDCDDYRISGYGKNGCPSRYECVQNGNELRDDSADKELDTEALISTIEKYQSSILSKENVEIIRYEITEDKSLVAIVYTDGDKKYKTLYSFSPSANEFNFIEKAHFEESESGNWEILSGENTQTGSDIKIIKANGEDEPRSVSSDMRLYENSHKEFSLEYPKNWYFRSFGAINNTRWIVGFSDKEVEALSDSVITVSILDEDPGNSSEEYYAVRERSDESVYMVEGPENLKDVIDAMADSIQ